MKGRGKDATGAGENAAAEQVTSSGLDMIHTISKTVANTASAYWAVSAAHKNLGILKSAEIRAEKLLEKFRTLIRMQERPAADIDQVKANLADKTTDRIQGETSLFNARQQLGLAMGLDLDRIETIADVTDDLPLLMPSGDRPRLSDTRGFADLAMANRNDLKAAKNGKMLRKFC